MHFAGLDRNPAFYLSGRPGRRISQTLAGYGPFQAIRQNGVSSPFQLLELSAHHG